MSAISKMRYIA